MSQRDEKELRAAVEEVGAFQDTMQSGQEIFLKTDKTNEALVDLLCLLSRPRPLENRLKARMFLGEIKFVSRKLVPLIIAYRTSYDIVFDALQVLTELLEFVPVDDFLDENTAVDDLKAEDFSEFQTHLIYLQDCKETLTFGEAGTNFHAMLATIVVDIINVAVSPDHPDQAKNSKDLIVAIIRVVARLSLIPDPKTQDSQYSLSRGSMSLSLIRVMLENGSLEAIIYAVRKLCREEPSLLESTFEILSSVTVQLDPQYLATFGQRDLPKFDVKLHQETARPTRHSRFQSARTSLWSSEDFKKAGSQVVNKFGQPLKAAEAKPELTSQQKIANAHFSVNGIQRTKASPKEEVDRRRNVVYVDRQFGESTDIFNQVELSTRGLPTAATAYAFVPPSIFADLQTFMDDLLVNLINPVIDRIRQSIVVDENSDDRAHLKASAHVRRFKASRLLNLMSWFLEYLRHKKVDFQRAAACLSTSAISFGVQKIDEYSRVDDKNNRTLLIPASKSPALMAALRLVLEQVWVTRDSLKHSQTGLPLLDNLVYEDVLNYATFLGQHYRGTLDKRSLAYSLVLISNLLDLLENLGQREFSVGRIVARRRRIAQKVQAQNPNKEVAKKIMTKEIRVTLRELVYNLYSTSLVRNLLDILALFQTNPRLINRTLTVLLQKFLKMESATLRFLLQYQYLYLFRDILRAPAAEHLEDLKVLSKFVVDRFFKVARLNSLMFLEALFPAKCPKSSQNHLLNPEVEFKQILGNYKECGDTLEALRQSEFMEVLKARRQADHLDNSKKFTEEEKERLTAHYLTFQDQPKCFEIIHSLMETRHSVEDVKSYLLQVFEDSANQFSEAAVVEYLNAFPDVNVQPILPYLDLVAALLETRAQGHQMTNRDDAFLDVLSRYFPDNFDQFLEEELETLMEMGFPMEPYIGNYYFPKAFRTLAQDLKLTSLLNLLGISDHFFLFREVLETYLEFPTRVQVLKELVSLSPDERNLRIDDGVEEPETEEPPIFVPQSLEDLPGEDCLNSDVSTLGQPSEDEEPEPEAPKDEEEELTAPDGEPIQVPSEFEDLFAD